MFPEQHIFEVTCGQECIAAGTYFEQGGWNKTGGGGGGGVGHVTRVMRDTMIQKRNFC